MFLELSTVSNDIHGLFCNHVACTALLCLDRCFFGWLVFTLGLVFCLFIVVVWGGRCLIFNRGCSLGFFHYFHVHCTIIKIYVTLPPEMSRMETFCDFEVFAA